MVARAWLVGPLAVGALLASSYGCTQIIGLDHEYVVTVEEDAGPPPMIACGDKPCPFGGPSACCWHKFDSPQAGECVKGLPVNDGCNTDALKGQDQSRIECQLPSQCPSGVCCGIRAETDAGDMFFSSVTCQPSCPSPNVSLCATEGETQPGCPDQTSCHTTNSLPPMFFICY